MSERDTRTSQAEENPWSLSLGKVSGIPIRIHFTFFLLLAWVALGTSGPGRWFGLLYMLSIFACVVLHELGHSLVAQRYGIGVAEIVLYPIGGVARMERLPRPRQELWIALAGPAVNVVIAAVIYTWLRATNTFTPIAEMELMRGNLLQNVLFANIVLAVFNMLPAFPMDGGRVLRALLAMRMSEVRATETAAAIGQFLAILFGFFALVQGNFLWMFIAFFVYVGAGQEAAMYRSRELVQGLNVQAAMITDFHTLPVGATLGEAAELLLKTSQQDFPVMNGEEVAGLLTRQNLLRGLAEHGPGGYVAGAMTRDFIAVPAEHALEEIASEMQSGRHPAVLVMDNGRLAGMVTLENIAELLVVRQITRPGDDRPARVP